MVFYEDSGSVLIPLSTILFLAIICALPKLVFSVLVGLIGVLARLVKGLARLVGTCVTSNPRDAITTETNRVPATVTRTSPTYTVTTSQPHRPARIVRSPEPRRPPTTLLVPLANNRNRTCHTRRLPPPQTPITNSNSQSAPQQPPSTNRNPQRVSRQSESASSGEPSRGNERNSPLPSRTPTPVVLSSVNEPNSRHPHCVQIRDPTPKFSLDSLNSFHVAAQFQEESCPICLEPLQTELVSAGSCLHFAHTSCLKHWLVTDTLFTCPVCRVPIAETSP